MKHVTFDEYASAITRLLPVAQRDTGQSGKVAQALLSLYNSYNFHCALVVLGGLDENLYRRLSDCDQGPSGNQPRAA